MEIKEIQLDSKFLSQKRYISGYVFYDFSAKYLPTQCSVIQFINALSSRNICTRMKRIFQKTSVMSGLNVGHILQVKDFRLQNKDFI